MDRNLFTPEISDALIKRLPSTQTIAGYYLGRLYYTSSKDEEICSRVADILSNHLKEDLSFEYLEEFLNEFRGDTAALNNSSFLDNHIDRGFQSLFLYRVTGGVFPSMRKYHRFSVPFRAALFDRVSPQNKLAVSGGIIKDDIFYLSLEFICLTIYQWISTSIFSKKPRRDIDSTLLIPLYEYAANHKNWEQSQIDYRTSTVLLLMNVIQQYPPYGGAYKNVPEFTLTKELWEKLKKANDNNTMTSLMLKVIYDNSDSFGGGALFKRYFTFYCRMRSRAKPTGTLGKVFSSNIHRILVAIIFGTILGSALRNKMAIIMNILILGQNCEISFMSTPIYLNRRGFMAASIRRWYTSL